MMFRRTASAIGSFALVLTAYSSPTAAHGVSVTADIDETVATLELTDETGEVCLTVDPAPEKTAVAAIVDDATNDVLLILGEGFGTTPMCQFFDAAIVDGVLTDVDAHRFVIAFGEAESSGVLTKPLPRTSETTTTGQPSSASEDDDREDDGPNVPFIFGMGLVAGVAVVVLRKRLSS